MKKNKYPNSSWGTIVEGIFLKKASYAKHFMRKFNAWGFDQKVALTTFPKCNAIVLFDTDNMIYYVTIPETFIRHSFKHDFGYRPQLFLTLNHWKKVFNEQEVDETIKEYRKTEQPKLF